MTKRATIDEPVPTGDDAARRALRNRLRRLEGQVRGLQRMVEEGRSCRDVLTLLASVRSAVDAAGDVILESYAERCALELERGDDTVRDLIEAVRLARG